MEYIEAGKFIRNKRKNQGFSTQKKFIAALIKADPEINCSESYMSLIESGVKSPSVHLLDLIASILEMSPQEKGELLLIYKRVPNDFEFAVRSNLKESLKLTNIDKLKIKYEENKSKQNFNNLIRALVLEDKQDQATDLLKTSSDSSSSFIDLQDRTAKIAALTGNYDFAIQAFKLAYESCTDEFINTKADILMNIGVCYFNKALKIVDKEPLEALELMLTSREYLEKSLDLWSNYVYCLDEYARCNYHIADVFLSFIRNNKKLSLDKVKHEKIDSYIKQYKDGKQLDTIQKLSSKHFKIAIDTYKQILAHSERGDLPEKALKEAVYFYAYSLCKIKDFDQALIWINSINIIEQNWLTHFIKACYCNMRYEAEKKDDLLDEALIHINTAYEFEPEIV
ncbi:XRE family transcriptional regulator, partial [bacterium]